MLRLLRALVARGLVEQHERFLAIRPELPAHAESQLRVFDVDFEERVVADPAATTGDAGRASQPLVTVGGVAESAPRW